MTDTDESRKRIAKELRRGDISVVWLDGWTDAAIEEFRADMERRLRRPVSASRQVAAPTYVTFDAGKKPTT